MTAGRLLDVRGGCRLGVPGAGPQNLHPASRLARYWVRRENGCGPRLQIAQNAVTFVELRERHTLRNRGRHRPEAPGDRWQLSMAARVLDVAQTHGSLLFG